MNVLNRQKILSLFNCQNSGNCCRHPGFVYVEQQHIPAMASHLNISTDEFKHKFVRIHKGWPIIASTSFRSNCFLNCENKCDIYPHRPNHCKTYPDWDSIWESDDNLNNETLVCPGLKLAVQEFNRSNKT